MQSENRFFDDLSKIINGAAGTVAGVGREFESNARERAREWIGGLDFVSREEFEAVKAMAAQAREQVEALEARLAALEGGASKAGKPSDKAAS
ncbi:BMFP domain-containing protein YqiC [Sphingobium sp. B2D3A]|uniref:accessory factor UbiK family protein n=1 Tax=unclassified Sphingobium TaxID=2611147 RepID=UPI0022241862|nr:MULTISPECIES: accessory factor UbiK family protein [unclassified Sphingobium]MCW2337544.1 BMFP domain-containing protein YqiC [Sphingobium sp. B2D3A]MCW2369944.1 BMFP domain-containing protein YqiC [Sphingobium sp. B11D3D]MCW2381366.1 BMFP domain-containing protein YqiC [Sphingobium sp. B2D3B]MCW2384002.1 BMFP domain-containing protein YqiC [Sphingobium sp. B2D3D]MCW2398527.1 BMFP domain-containing protein YqiC [Sphingobium sp. B2D3C]